MVLSSGLILMTMRGKVRNINQMETMIDLLISSEMR
jgi:hypothetical protein